LSNKLFDQWGGIMKVRLQGARPEKIVNMALARGIFLWDVKKEKDFMTFRIRSSGYEALKSLADGPAGERSSPLRIGIVSMDLMRACVGAVFDRQPGFATVFRRIGRRASAASPYGLASLVWISCGHV
jgi:hypothetical protein